MKKNPKVAEVKPLDGKKLLVSFQTGEMKVYDCSSLLNFPAFSSLNNEGFFRTVRCDPGGYGVSWNEEVDISETELWLHGKPFQKKGEAEKAKSDFSFKEIERKKVQGFRGISPCIKKIEFVQKGSFSLFLKDGRIIIVPLKAFPSIKKLTPKQRQGWYLLDDEGFSFDDCEEVFHLEQVLGDFSENKYSFVPQNKHCAENLAPFVPVEKSKKNALGKKKST